MDEEEMSEFLDKISQAVDSLEDEEQDLKLDSERHEEFEEKLSEVHEQLSFLREVLDNQ